MNIQKLNSEVLLLIFITVFIFLGAGKAFDHRIVHNSPTGMMASDAFSHNWVAQNTYDTGYINKPPNYAFNSETEYIEKAGNYKMWGANILPMLTASMAKLSYLNVFDVNAILVFLFIPLMIVIIYFIISNFNENLALFSLPLTLLFLQRKFFISHSWGWWDFITGEFFLFAVVLLILNKKFKYRYFFNAILILTAFMAHGLEAGYAAIFIVFYLIFNLLFNRKDIYGLILEQVKSVLLVFIMGSFIIPFFLRTSGAYGHSQIRFLMSYETFMTTVYGGTIPNYFIFLNEFIGFRFLIILGFLICGYLLLKKKSGVLPYYFFVIFMSISPYIYIMAGERGFQWRFLWPIYLSFALGAVIFIVYSLLKIIINHAILKPVIFIICFMILLVIVMPLPFNGAGLVDEKDYESYKWINANTNTHSNVLIFFSPINSQVTRYYLLKKHFFLVTSETWRNLNFDNPILSNLQNFSHDYIDFVFFESSNYSMFKESHLSEILKKSSDYFIINQSICYFDYVYIPLKNNQEVHNKNIYYLSNLIKINISEIVFNNNAGAIIAKNIVKGEECERRFGNKA